MANLLTRNQVATLVAAVSPYKAVREENRRTVGRYIEVYVDCPTDELIKRDTTGKYKKALAGEIPHFTGVSDPYEPPQNPELVLETERQSPEESAKQILVYLEERELIPAAVAA